MIIYNGPSMIDGAPIVAIATGFANSSENAKTGALIQTWILRADMLPSMALRSGADVSICGDCVHRPDANGKRSCYVQMQAPHSVYRKYKRGTYPALVAGAAAGRIVRLGSYGDPAAVPIQAWRALLQDAAGWTGYTHAWRNPAASALRQYCMASVDSPTEATEAQRLGWRTFRVASGGIGRSLALDVAKSRMRGESLCPASAEAGRKLTCAACLACGGANGRRGNIMIPAHGSGKVHVNRRMEA